MGARGREFVALGQPVVATPGEGPGGSGVTIQAFLQRRGWLEAFSRERGGWGRSRGW